jgi:hypothetical protein
LTDIHGKEAKKKNFSLLANGSVIEEETQRKEDSMLGNCD